MHRSLQTLDVHTSPASAPRANASQANTALSLLRHCQTLYSDRGAMLYPMGSAVRKGRCRERTRVAADSPRVSLCGACISQHRQDWLCPAGAPVEAVFRMVAVRGVQAQARKVGGVFPLIEVPVTATPRRLYGTEASRKGLSLALCSSHQQGLGCPYSVNTAPYWRNWFKVA